jgi:ABC-type taurine transport system ATPase subunit
LTALYALLIEKILQKEPLPNGEKGYYFAMAHRLPWWTAMDRLASALHARGLVTEPKAQIWPSYEMAAEYLGFPLQYIRAMATAR